MSAYIVTTPKNPEYTGVVMGVPFNKGKAVVSAETLNPQLGYTVEQIVHAMQHDFGYQVTPMESPAPAPAAENPKETRKTRRKGAEVSEPAPS